jgi:hypothetical protein
MARSFVSEFLLPLVRGGKLHVGRPIGGRELEGLVRRWERRTDEDPPAPSSMSTEDAAAAELGWRRAARASAVLPGVGTPPLDETTLRLGAAVHNVLCLNHPALPGRVEGRAQEEIVRATAPFLDVGPPGSAAEAVRRYTLLARVTEIVLAEHHVKLWIGERRYVGRTPPARVLALEGLRRVQHETIERIWAKEVGVPTVGRGLWEALHAANPLAECLDPLRLDPPLSWGRMLGALRFAPLARIVAGRALDLGVVPVGNALAGALSRFVASRDPGRGAASTPEAVDFAVRFLAHLCWMHLLFGGAEVDALAGAELVSVVAAAADVDRRLVCPADLDASGALGRRFFLWMAALRDELRLLAPGRWEAAVEICRYARSARGGRDDGGPLRGPGAIDVALRGG